MIGGRVFSVIHISGMRVIKGVINVISRGNNLVGMMRGVNPLQIVPLDQVVVERSTGV